MIGKQHLQVVTIFTLVFLIFSCKEKPTKNIKTKEVIFTKQGSLEIRNKDTDSLVTKFDIEFAESDYETQTGLMYRKGMAAHEAMLFVFKNEAMHSFYMKNTAFSLDILYIDKNLKIVSIQENTEPFNESGLSSQVPVQYVLEINGGLSKKLNIATGDRIQYTKNK